MQVAPLVQNSHWGYRRAVKPLSLTLALLALACGGSKPRGPPVSSGAVEYPEWVTRGSRPVSTDEGMVLNGVGSATHIKNETLLEETADNRARAQIARLFATYLNSLNRDITCSMTAGDGGAEMVCTAGNGRIGWSCWY